MIPKELFHYTKKETALGKILLERTIRLGQISLTNDPKESRLNIGVSYTNKKSPGKWAPKVRAEAKRVFKEEWNVLCMTKNLPKRKYLDINKNQVMMQARYGYAHPKMWAYYGENHSGICLVFDGKKLNANIVATLKDRCKIFSGAVNYKKYGMFYSNPIDDSYIEKYGLTEGVRKYFFANYQELFLTKHPDWESEAEFRWLIHNPTNSPEYVSIEGAIKAVLVGSDFPQASEHVVKKLAKELKISAGRIIWHNGMPFASYGSIYEPKKKCNSSRL